MVNSFSTTNLTRCGNVDSLSAKSISISQQGLFDPTELTVFVPESESQSSPEPLATATPGVVFPVLLVNLQTRE